MVTVGFPSWSHAPSWVYISNSKPFSEFSVALWQQLRKSVILGLIEMCRQVDSTSMARYHVNGLVC